MTEHSPAQGGDSLQIYFDEPNVDDAESITNLHLASFVDGTINEDRGATREVLEAIVAMSTVKGGKLQYWREALSLPQEGRRLAVARYCGRIVGVAEREYEDGQQWLSSLYVAPDFYQKGIGSALLGRVCDIEEDTYLFVTEGAPAARFYQRRGFRPTSEHRSFNLHLPNGGVVPHIALRRPKKF